MKRVLLASLLLLPACNASGPERDPEGTLQPSKKRTDVQWVERGDSIPFRLVGGDTNVFYRAGESWERVVKRPSQDAAAACDATMTLMPYGDGEGFPIDTRTEQVGWTTLKRVKPGVYFFRTNTNRASCTYTVTFSPAR
ncbi:hypothetical protein [Deinococcus aquaedulcis]|uniref:hypothetical protein n=1 Tax=Deinococcus aquaedulcis TaxID=2840455 RepID=UPI001C82ED88|nr:hypothetical protein [Deinococcus aquaedulcis]